MGNYAETFCCIDNNEIINNQNFPSSFNNKDTEEKYHTLIDSHKERLPSNLIKLPISKDYNNSNVFEHSSRVPITSRNVIIKKKGEPFADYEILTKLGEGTYGKVYKVKNKLNNSVRAMKQIEKHWLGDINDSEVMKEITILKSLNHPYIIKLYEYYVTDDYIFLISELCNEGDLQSKIVKIKIFPEFIVKIIMLQVFKALMYLNEKRIIHGDLKLENILVECYDERKNKKNKYDKDGFINAIKHDMELMKGKIKKVNSFSKYKRSSKEVSEINKKINEEYKRDKFAFGTNFRFRAKKDDKKNTNKIEEEDIIRKGSNNIYDFKNFYIYNYGIKLIDFGCSKMFSRTKNNFHDIIGTLVYCSPEVLANNYNETCDVWSCGVLMYCLLSGSFPFKGKDEEEIIRSILSGKFEFEIDRFNGISDEVKDLISKCLKYEQKKRITIKEALNHRFFDDLKRAKKFTDEEIEKLNNLRHLNKFSKFYQLVLTYLSYNFSDHTILNELNELYDKIDKNNDYKITKSELYKAYKEAEIQINEEELDGIIDSVDFDMSGCIDYEEFIRICIPKEKLFTEKNLENAFLLLDKEKKGFITASKITHFIQSHKHIKDKLKQKIKNEILDIGDEIIDLEEFKSLMFNLSNSG